MKGFYCSLGSLPPQGNPHSTRSNHCNVVENRGSSYSVWWVILFFVQVLSLAEENAMWVILVVHIV